MRLEQSHTENIVTQIDQGKLVVKKNGRYERIDQAYRTIVNSFRGRDQISYNVTLNV